MRLLTRNVLEDESIDDPNHHHIWWTVGIIVIICILIMIMQGCALSENVPKKGNITQINAPVVVVKQFYAGYSLDAWADAIRRAENNDNYGILSVKCTKGADCRRICKNTVRNTFKRWKNAGKPGEFVEFLQKRYCPVGCGNDRGTNKYWLFNVKWYLEHPKGGDKMREPMTLTRGENKLSLKPEYAYTYEDYLKIYESVDFDDFEEVV